MSNKYISYKRYKRTFDYNIGVDFESTGDIQNFFNELIVNGFEVIWYNEEIEDNCITITIFCGKIKQTI